MIRKLKQVYNKDDLDFSKGQVDPFKFHSTFYFFLKAFQVIDTKLPKWTYLVLITMFVNGIIGVTLALISTGHGVYIADIPVLTEAVVYTIVLIYKMLILSCAQLDKPDYYRLLRIMREDFQYACSEKCKYRERFFKKQLETWKICLWCLLFTMGTGVAMDTFAIFSLFFYLATRTPGDGTQRPLLLPFWLGEVDFEATPVYEIALSFSNFCILTFAFTYVFMIQTEIVWIRQITTKADLIIWALQDVLQDIHPATNAREKVHYAALIKYRMREIVSQHQSMYTLLEAYARVYKKLLMFEQKLCGPVICLTAYCTAEKLDEEEINAILVLLSISTAVLTFIPSYLCTFLAMKINSVSDACWNISFWNAGPEIRPYLVLIMQRSQRPLSLQAPGFNDVSLQTFSSSMASAYSMFNMLRQTNNNK